MRRLVVYAGLAAGAVLLLLGALPFLVAYPYGAGPNSGPANEWELVIMLAYEGRIAFLLVGSLLLAGSLLQRRIRARAE